MRPNQVCETESDQRCLKAVLGGGLCLGTSLTATELRVAVPH